MAEAFSQVLSVSAVHEKDRGVHRRPRQRRPQFSPQYRPGSLHAHRRQGVQIVFKCKTWMEDFVCGETFVNPDNSSKIGDKEMSMLEEPSTAVVRPQPATTSPNPVIALRRVAVMLVNRCQNDPHNNDHGPTVEFSSWNWIK